MSQGKNAKKTRHNGKHSIVSRSFLQEKEASREYSSPKMMIGE